MDIIKTRVAIAGGGPAGIMLGYLLARAGIDVVILEKWPDFFRDFRGDTIHPSTMQVLHELGLLERFLALPHNEMGEMVARMGGREITVADFAHLRVRAPFIAFIPQWDFLNFLVEEGRRFPGFHLMMETEAADILTEGEEVAGLSARSKDGAFEIRADLTVGADGRHSTVREKSGLELEDLGAPIDVLWFRLPRQDDGTKRSLGYLEHGRGMVLLDRDTYWQCGYIIKKGGFDAIRQAGLERFRSDIVALAPFLKPAVSELASLDDVKLLSVSVDRLRRWYRPGLLCIGDAAHAMSPVGGIGINLAIQDAVAAANILIPALRKGRPQASDLERLERRRERPARMTQRMQVYLHRKMLAPALRQDRPMSAPWFLRLLAAVPMLRRLPAYVIGVGLRPEHVHADGIT